MPELRIPVTDMRRYLPGDFNRLTIRADITACWWQSCKCSRHSVQHLEGSGEAKVCAAIHDELLLLLVKVEDVEKPVEKRLAEKCHESAEAKWLGTSKS